MIYSTSIHTLRIKTDNLWIINEFENHRPQQKNYITFSIFKEQNTR